MAHQQQPVAQQSETLFSDLRKSITHLERVLSQFTPPIGAETTERLTRIAIKNKDNLTALQNEHGDLTQLQNWDNEGGRIA